MHSLILTVLSIVLMATVTVAAVSYLPSGEEFTQETELLVTDGLEELEASWNRYRKANETYTWVCETYTGETGETFEECWRELDDPGYLDDDGWKSTLFPEYGFLPPTPISSSWRYKVTDTGEIYFCLEGNIAQPEREGIKRASRMFPDNAFILNDTCGAKSDTTFSEDYTGNVALTYWLVQG